MRTRVPPAFLLSLLAACSSSAPAASAPPGSYLAILNKTDATIAIVEPNSGHTKDTAPTGIGPHEAAASRDGYQVVVCDYGDQRPGNTLTVFDLRDRRVVKTIDLTPHQRPHGIEFLDRRTVLVTSETSKAVLQVDLESGEVERAMDTGANTSHMLVITPDHSRVFTANIGSGSVSAIDLASGRLLETIPTGVEPEAIDVSPDGREVWVGHRQSNTLAVIDARTLEKTAEIPCATMPIRLKFTRDGREVWVTCVMSGDVAIFDAKARREIARVVLEPLAKPLEDEEAPSSGDPRNPIPVGLLMDPSGRHAFVANMAAERISVIDVASRAIRAQIPTGKGPDGMAWCYAPERFAFVGETPDRARFPR